MKIILLQSLFCASIYLKSYFYCHILQGVFVQTKSGNAPAAYPCKQQKLQTTKEISGSELKVRKILLSIFTIII
jgi:hypothetical protein